MSKADELKKKLMSKPVQTIESSQSTVVSGMTDTQEIKTTWHPVENIAGAGSGY